MHREGEDKVYCKRSILGGRIVMAHYQLKNGGKVYVHRKRVGHRVQIRQHGHGLSHEKLYNYPQQLGNETDKNRVYSEISQQLSQHVRQQKGGSARSKVRII